MMKKQQQQEKVGVSKGRGSKGGGQGGGIADVAAYQESLAVARAALRLRRAALQKCEDALDISALEKDVALAAREPKLRGDM